MINLFEYAESKEIGDWNFPLEVDVENHITTDHDHVGKTAKITEHANEILKDNRGDEVKITGVIEKFGQIVGYQAELNGETIYAPKKDFYVGMNYVEDIHADGAKAEQIRRLLAHWQTQHDYYGPSWDGIELFHFELAKATDAVGIESAGWYKYDTSLRSDMDGKNWRLVIPDKAGCVAVNCHSILHDDVWTLNTTIYSTREISKKDIKLYGHKDHWQRTLGWTIKVAKVLETDGYDYSDVIQNLMKRKKISWLTTKKAHQILPGVIEVYKKETGNTLDWLPYVSFGISDNQIPPGKIGTHRSKTDVVDYSIITMHPQSLMRGRKYYEIVIKHELLHYVLAQTNNPFHNEQFVRMGQKLNIPQRFLD